MGAETKTQLLLWSEALIIKNRLNAKNAHIICGGAGTSLDGFEKVSIK